MPRTIDLRQPLDTDRLVRPGEFASRLGVSLVTLWRMRRRGEVPPPRRISPGCVAWPSRDVAAVLASIGGAR